MQTTKNHRYLRLCQVTIISLLSLLFIVSRPYNSASLIDPYTYVELNTGAIDKFSSKIEYQEPIIDIIIKSLFFAVGDQYLTYVLFSGLFVFFISSYSLHLSSNNYIILVFLYIVLNPSLFVLICNLWRQGLACCFLLLLVEVSKNKNKNILFQSVAFFLSLLSHFTVAPFLLSVIFCSRVKNLDLKIMVAGLLSSYLTSRFSSEYIGSFILTSIDGYKDVGSNEVVRRGILLCYYILYAAVNKSVYSSDVLNCGIMVFAALGVQEDGMFARLYHYPFVVTCMLLLGSINSRKAICATIAVGFINILILLNSSTFNHMIQWSNLF